MSPSVTIAAVPALLCAVLALAAGQTVRLTFNGVEYGSRELTTEKNTKIHAFYGIPYARQPVGRFRFSRPEPLSKLNEWQLSEEERRRYYTTPPSQPRSCPQIDPFSNMFDTAYSVEDCLRIDLYVLDEVFTNQQSSSQKYGMSVLVEGLEFKSGVARYLNPTLGAFKEQNAVGVLAVVHYRLGALGFLTTEDDEGPANLGLWDQHEALKFLKEQVVTGQIPQVDQLKISVLGFGSGGVSTSIHMLNPVNKALFTTALVSGGSALGPDANVRDARDRAYEFARRVGCTSSSSRKLIACLRGVDDLHNLVKIAAEPQFLFGPVVDFNHTRDPLRAYIGDHPERLMRRESFDNVHGVLYGFPENAGSYRYYTQTQQTPQMARSAALQGRPTFAAAAVDSIENRIKFYLSPFQSHGDTSRALAASVKFLYFRNYTDDVVMQNQTLFDSLMINALTDYLSLGPVVSAAHIHASKKLTQQQTNVYIYYREAEPQLSTLSSKLAAMSAALVKYGTYLDDMLQFVGVAGISAAEPDAEQRVIRNAATIFSDLFGKPGRSAQDVAGIREYKPNTLPIYYITAVRGKGSVQTLDRPYREPNRIFWSKYVPTIGTILDDISQKSRDRKYEALAYKKATFGTAVPLAILVIVCIALGVLLWKSRRSGSSPMASVQFQKVSTNEP